jgi:hypothetical protein
MANKRANQLNVSDPEYRPTMPEPLAAITRPQGEVGDAIYKASDELATRANKIADEFAKIEGARAGQIAGVDEKWRPNDSTTIRGTAFEEAATTTYTNMLEANLDRDMRTAAVELRDSPGALTKKLDEIKADYMQRHVFPQIRGQFETKFERTRTFLTVDSLQLQKTRTEEAARASSIPRRDALDNQRNDILDMPDGPEKDKLLEENDKERKRTYENDVKNGGSAVDAARSYSKDQENNEILRVMKAPAKIEDPEDYKTAATAALEQARRRGAMSPETIFKIEQQIEAGYRTRQSRTEHSEAKVAANMDALRVRAAEGAIIPEAEKQTLRLAAKTPKEKQIVEDGLAKAEELAILAKKTPAQLDAEIARLREKAQAQAGASATDVQLLKDAEVVRKHKEQSDAERVRKIEAGETKVKEGVDALRDRSAANQPIPEAEKQALRDKAKTPKEKALVEDGLKKAEELRTLSAKSPAEIDQELARLQKKAQEGGATPADKQLFDDLMAVKKAKEAGAAEQERRVKAGETKVEKVVKDFEERGKAGLPISDAEKQAALATATTPREKQLIMAGIMRADNLRKMAEMSPEQLDAEERAIRERARKTGASSAETARLIADLTETRDARKKVLEKDPVSDAIRTRQVDVGPLNLSLAHSDAPDDKTMLEAQLRARKPMDKFTEQHGAPDRKLTDTEVAQGKQIYERGGKPAFNLVTAIVKVFGDKAGPVLEEIGGQQMKGVGGLAILPGPPEARHPVIKDAVNGQMKLNDKEIKGKLPAEPDNREEIFRTEFGTAMSGADKARVQQTAFQIYTERAYRAGVTKDDDKAKEIYREALRAAAGKATMPSGNSFGGPASYQPGGTWFRRTTTWSQKTIVPPNIRTDKFRDVIDSITDADLTEFKHEDGRAVKADDLKEATPVRTPKGYIFVRGDPASEESPVIGDVKGGKPVVIDFDKKEVEQKYRDRVPKAYTP